MNLQELLDKTRQAISNYADDDSDKWFYANRFVFARLQLDERKTKTQVKKTLLEANVPCDYCKKSFEDKTGVHLHRIDGERGYSLDNCVLMHPNCHTRFHSENPPAKQPSRQAKLKDSSFAAPILEKESRRYNDKPFTYWWDISPRFLDNIDEYEAIEFVKKDTCERCYVPTLVLKRYLTKERQTSRGKGNWGIKVLKKRESELAFEPGNNKEEWLFLLVVWLNEKQDD
jgi:hypothetical protein